MGSLGKEVAPNSLEPILIELTRLENNLREKERELGAAHSEIKALKVTEHLKDKALVELSNELKKLEVKQQNVEKHLEDKNVEVKKLTDEKKDALAGQFAAEATLRRVHASQKVEESLPIEAIVAPYESEIQTRKNEIACLQDSKKALERLIKSKDSALMEAERMFQSAQERAMNVENLQNQNLELKRQIEICQDENRILEKTNRQKVIEVEKLAQTISELEESILAGGVAANMVRDYQRRLAELNEEKRTLERELSRAKVSANRVATSVANEWKDDGDKVIPIKQWIEERKFLQGEIQRLRDKLAISERTIKAETQLRDKFKLRLKILEEGLKNGSDNSEPKKRSTSQPRPSVASIRSSVLQQPSPASGMQHTRRVVQRNNSLTKISTGEILIRKNLWAPRSKFCDDRGKENTEAKVNTNGHMLEVSNAVKANEYDDVASQSSGSLEEEGENLVSGFLYDKLQKEVISARKLIEQKDGALDAKDDEIKLLQRKVEALTRAIEVESKKARREAAAKEKETTLLNSDDNKQKPRTPNLCKRSVRSPNPRTQAV